MDASPAPILLLGHPALREPAQPITDLEDPRLASDVAKLHATLEAFRARHGFGRAIAAPQIGIPRRIIALHLERGPATGSMTLINPEITWESEATFTLWDDCMSFPWLLVRLARHASISIVFSDRRGELQTWERLDPSTSELLQHEIDHLDGVLAVDRALPAAVGHDAIVSRTTFEAMPGYFREQVDDPGEDGRRLDVG